MNRIRSQQYAQKAYGLVEAIKIKKEQGNKDLADNYRTIALNLPTMLQQSGLCQTTGFLLAKGAEKEGKECNKNLHFRLLLTHLTELLEGNQDFTAFHQKILDANLSQYQLLTRNTLEAASWLKRYTQALLPKEDNKKESQSCAN